MKYSISTRFFRPFIIILILFGFLSYLLSNIFIDSVVISANKSLIERNLEVNLSYFEEKRVNENTINNIAGRNDIGIIIYENGKILSCSSVFLCSEYNGEMPEIIYKHFPSISEGNGIFVPFKYRLLEVNQIVYIYNIDNNRFVIINKALDSIEQTNNILRPFITYTILFIFIIGSIVIKIVTKKISKPIIKISDYAKDIANLKFDHKIEVDSQDEIGQLANNMNYISERLHFSLEELKKANELILEDLNKEKELDKKRVKFFSTVSHELKTPLTIIQGYAEGINYNIVKNPDDVKEYLEVIIDETKKMNNLVNDLINLSRYESDNFSLQKSEFDIVKLVESTTFRYKDSILDKTINLYIIGSKTCTVFADQFRMEQVINNLISNALKYVEQDGIISVNIIEKLRTVQVSFYNNGEQIIPEELDKIWDLFYKLENNKNKVGTGLGLAIVKSIIELHHGRYGVENKNSGVEFFIEIPKNSLL